MARTERSASFTRDVPHRLTDQESLERNDSAAQLEREADELEAKLKLDTKDRKDHIASLRAQAKRKRAAAADRKELRSVSCHEEIKGWQVLVVRDDTGEVVDQRALEATEQTDFAGLDESKPDDLPEPDYSPSSRSPKAPTEKARKGRSKK